MKPAESLEGLRGTYTYAVLDVQTEPPVKKQRGKETERSIRPGP